MRRGIIFCFAGPSGSGKTTLSEMFRRKSNGSVSRITTVTTRAPRSGEVDGIDYHFWSEDYFRFALRDDLFFEHEKVHGNMYGTLSSSLEQVVTDRKMSLIILDVNGAIKLKNKFPDDVVNVFLTCSHRSELRRRIEERNTAPEDLTRRLNAAALELDIYKANVDKFDYLIVNDDLNVSWTVLSNIATHEGVKRGDVFRFADE